MASRMKKKNKQPTGRGGGGSSALGQSLFHSAHPSPTFASPYHHRQQIVETTTRHNGLSSQSPSWGGAQSPGFGADGDEDNYDSYGEESGLDDPHGFEPSARNGNQQPMMKRRELGWTTSFPAEYHRAHKSTAYQQTLAYQEQLNQRKRHDQQMANALSTPSTVAAVSPLQPPPASKDELELLKQVTMREGILHKLTTLAHTAAAATSSVGGNIHADTGNELLQLLLQLRDASVSVVRAMANWHRQNMSPTSKPRAFVFHNQNYCAKMVSDFNFLAAFSSLSRILGVDPVRMKQNPFMMPSPIPDRNFHDVQQLSASTPPRFAFSDPIGRVAEAEKYLVWSLVNLPTDDSTIGTRAGTATGQPPSSASPEKNRRSDLLTWQQRAEKQLRLLSMPLESPTGHAHVMDSSRMMKRKGYLPALPMSPPKTLTQLMENVHKGGYTSPTKSTCFSSFEAGHDGLEYRMTALDVEVLGSNDAPPHAIVTLVAASVLILLSPSDRIPKDLSWKSCQKMFTNGLKLVQRLHQVDTTEIPSFKWKALVPFLENEHYHPMFLMEYSCAAATLCAWVLHVLTQAQAKESDAYTADDDRREILDELEQEQDDDQQGLPDQGTTTAMDATRASLTSSDSSSSLLTRPPSRSSLSSRSGKRVSIGNAEVLFINENEPVSPPTSSHGSHASQSAAANAHRRHVLLRTSPWTHRGVTYFVSFFLEKDKDQDDAISIKMYEPMSSVESQMFVSFDDLKLDFGEKASDLFQRREFSVLCDLILCQLDGMMTMASNSASNSARSSTSITTTPRKEALPRRHVSSDEDDDGPVQEDDDDRGAKEKDSEAAAVRIQCLTRKQHAKKRVDTMREQRDATVRIQCAMRQRRARDTVKHVRFAKEQQHAQHQQWSATKIQSIARQKQAKKKVAHLKLLQRQQTGLAKTTTTSGSAPESEGEEESDEQGDAEEYEQPIVAAAASRPETASSEQFEDDFEDE